MAYMRERERENRVYRRQKGGDIHYKTAMMTLINRSELMYQQPRVCKNYLGEIKIRSDPEGWKLVTCLVVEKKKHEITTGHEVYGQTFH